MLEYNSGLLSTILRFCHLDLLNQRWLSDPSLAMATVSSMSIYLIGIPVMYYMADLSAMNKSVFEAAIIDGARMRDVIFLIIYPVLKNTHKTIAISLLLGGFREMEARLSDDRWRSRWGNRDHRHLYLSQHQIRRSQSRSGCRRCHGDFGDSVRDRLLATQVVCAKSGKMKKMEHQDLFLASLRQKRIMRCILVALALLWVLPLYSFDH